MTTEHVVTEDAVTASPDGWEVRAVGCRLYVRLLREGGMRVRVVGDGPEADAVRAELQQLEAQDQ